MSEHTPGPWQRLGHTFIGTVEDDPQVVAHTSNHRNRKARPVHESEANANLLTAAPDLLAACEGAPQLHFKAGVSVGTFLHRYREWYDGARQAAIDYAKGESE